MILKLANLTFEAPAETLDVGESVERETEGAELETEFIVAEVEERAEKVVLFAVANTG
jgi:hypothetical protein